MRRKPMTAEASAKRVIKDILRATRRHFAVEDKIRIVLDGLRGEDNSAERCRREGIERCWNLADWPRGTSGTVILACTPASRHEQNNR